MIYLPLYHYFNFIILIILSHKIHCMQDLETITGNILAQELSLIQLIKYLQCVHCNKKHCTLVNIFALFHSYLFYL